MINKATFESYLTLMDLANILSFNSATTNICIYPLADEYGDGVNSTQLNDAIAYAEGTDEGEVLDSNSSLGNIQLGIKHPCD